MYRLITRLITVLWVVAAADVEVSTVSQDELRSAVIVNQLLLSQQTDILKELLNNTQHNQGPYCPHPYTQVLDECFYLSTHKLTWEKARQHCQGMLGDLASPKHPYALKSFIISSIGIGDDKTVFVGGEDESKNRQFKWLDGRVIATSDWSPGEPNNSHGREFCVNLYNTRHPVFNDISCDEQHLFACQYYRPKAN
ncbi:hypothetical protein OTU49_015593 [Cherax quadricarinatus]|uniref:C-type lectin domain-containing protein n=1 Tax=Cherax quadricarinatus TaxID=27406 RepID=A0AAW0YA96_CHEQU